MKPWAPGDALAGEERSFYVRGPRGLIAVVRHQAAQPRATIVLAGPMTLERSHGYLSWVRWARTLATNGYEVLRFDYGGVGESPGEVAAQTFDGWRDDLEAVIAVAAGPVIVLGLRLGALLGARVFEAGRCDGFIAWDPPAGGKQMLLEMLRRKLAADLMELSGERHSRDEYVRRLDAGELVEVEGYEWSKALFHSAEAFTFTEPTRAAPWTVLRFDGHPVRIPKPPFWLQSNLLVPELSELFSTTIAWLDQLQLPARATASAPAEDPASSALETLVQPAGTCVGTSHAPARRTSRVGMLWLNSGYVPRDGHGGLARHISEVMAARGVPCFRFDLPGLGDAPGPLLPDTQHFFPFVTGGGFTPVVRQLVRRLCERDGLEGVVLAGLCGGAVNAIYTGDAERELVRGIVLLEPELYVTEPQHAAGEAPRERLRDRLGARLPSPLGALVKRELPFEDRLRAKLFSYWGWMRLLTHENAYARYVPLPRKAILDFVLSRSELPSVTNLPLAHAWQRWVTAQRPVLTITAKGKLREVFFDRINEKVLAGVTRRHYEHVRLENTNHIFTSGGAIAAVTAQVVQAWPTLSARPAS